MVPRAALFVFILLATCARPAHRDADAPTDLPADADRHFVIWLGGARVGTARETETWSANGVTLRRNEEMRFLRGDTPVALGTSIEIVADRALVPLRVVWTEHAQRTRKGVAVRDRLGWLVTDDSGVRRLPAADAIPAELAPLVVRRDGRFAGAIFLPARGFVTGNGRIDQVAPQRLVARLAFDGGAVAEATIDLAGDQMPARIVDGEGVIAIRASAEQAAQGFAAADLIAATSIPLAGHGSAIILDGDLALPPVPGQSAHPARTGIALELSSALPGDLPAGPSGADRTREIGALVHRVHARIAPDLAAAATSARDAAGATAGDCTTFALAYAALASERDIPTRLVTGLRVDGDRLVRHRWAVSWTGARWIAVDAAFGAAPAGGNLIGLAIHDPDDAGLVAGEAALTRVRGARRE